MSHPLRKVGGVLFPKRCPSCGVLGRAPCVECARTLRRATGTVSVAGVASCRPVFVYDEGVRTLLLALKYRNRRDALGYLAGEIAGVVDVDADVVTWVPTTAARRRARGFDQAELLARGVGRHVRLPVRSLAPARRQPPADGARCAGASPGPRVFRRPPARIVARTVLLIDDIGTTGATLQAAALALTRAGWREIHPPARTPGGGSRAEPL